MKRISGLGFLQELRRRRVFRVAGLYIVGAWLSLQAADILFPGWGIPDEAIQVLVWTALLGFPVALAFGWVFDITPEGIRRTLPVSSPKELRRSLPLRRIDYLVLGLFTVVVVSLLFDASSRVLRSASPGISIDAPAERLTHSVAVLPFTSLSGDPEHGYFASGISEEILNRLSAYAELKVIARTSSFIFRDGNHDIARISNLLGVEYVLQGSVRRDGARLRIAAQLADHAGVQLWTRTFDRDMGGIFALQDEIAAEVAASIVPRISSPGETVRQPDIEAWQEFVIGREIMNRGYSLWFERAPRRFDRALAIDPDFAEPYAGRAIARLGGIIWSTDPGKDLQLAEEDIQRALAINPRLAEAHVARALHLAHRDPRNLAAYEAALRRALELDPRHVMAMNRLAANLDQQGRYEEAFQLLNAAARVDPLAISVNMNLAMEEYRVGNFAEAERRLLRLTKLPQPSPFAYGSLGSVYMMQGRVADACRMQQQFVLAAAADTGQPGGLQGLASFYSILGYPARADRAFETWVAAWPENHTLPWWRALILRGVRDPSADLKDLLAQFAVADVELSSVPTEFRLLHGHLLSLVDDHAGAIAILREVIDTTAIVPLARTERMAAQSLAWSYLQSGQQADGRAILERADQWFRKQREQGRMHASEEIYFYARNTLLMGDLDAALDLLEEAERMGWRESQGLEHDPVWEPVRPHPRFQGTMTRIADHLAAERTRFEAAEATEADFGVRLQAAIEQGRNTENLR